jgi:sigma-B regulation protein RsbU (phosphoserine phosphatase)
MNLNLEEKVRTRTNELLAANEELEAMNETIIETNRKLEDASRIAQLDMKMAANVQTSFFPKTSPRTSNWDTAFVFRPMSGVSGDFLDFYITDGRLDGLVLMDVSGHGIASGLLTMIARSIFRRNFYTSSDKKLNEILEASNRELINEIGMTEMYLTGIMLRFSDDAVEYVNAAHEDILCKNSKSVNAIKMHLKDVDFKGMFLGKAETEDTYTTVKLIHHKNDALILFTDGITESKNAGRKEFGIDNLIMSFKNAPEGPASTILGHIMKDFERHLAEVPPGDDLTVIVLKSI